MPSRISVLNCKPFFQVIIHHLDDTALISEAHGEWGLAYKLVSDVITNRSPFVPCGGDPLSLKYHLIDAIWDNPCPAYAGLQKQLEAAKVEMDKWVLRIPRDSSMAVTRKDTTGEPLRWW